jgi:thiazole/oxazole-forming peptide maturase SagD family component
MIEKDENLTWGTASDLDLATVKSTMEALERFAAGNVDGGRLRLARHGDLGATAIAESALLRFTPEQLERNPNLRPANDNDAVHFVEGRLAHGAPRFVPARCVHYPFAEIVGGRLRTSLASSSGMAAHRRREDAELLAYRELVERDAIMRTWLQKRCPPAIAMSSYTQRARALHRRVKAAGWECGVRDISCGNGFAALALAVSPGEGLVLGASAGPVDAAIEKALTEVAAVLFRGARDHADAHMECEAVATARDHALLYADPSKIARASFLWSSQVEVCPAVDKTATADTVPPDVIVIDLSLPEYPDVSVARCLCPRLVPIMFGYDHEPLGMLDLPDGGATGPRWPHPFS